MKKFRSILRRNHSHDSPNNPHFDEVTEEIANEYCEANGVPMQRVKHEDDHQFEGEEATSHYHLVIEEGHQRDIHRAIVLHPSIQFPVHAREVAVKRVLVLYNPESGSHKGEKIALKAIAIMRSSGVDVQSIPLERRGHGEEICKTVDLKSFDVVTFIGGDGTIHECINGLMKRSDSEGKNIPVAIIAAGTGNSFSLELTGGTNMKTAVHKILAGVHVPIDIAKVTQFEVGPNGQMDKDVMYSFNSLHWGLASRVNVTAEKLRWMGKAVRYTTAGLVELFKGEQTLAKIKFEEADGKVTEYEDKFCLAIANNIVTAAKGMKMAPRAKLNDGLIDLLLIRSSKTLDLVSVFSKVYDGTHTQLDFVEYVQVKWFTIVPYKDNGRPLVEGDPEVAEELVDVDGELKGATPLICQVLPLAIKVII